MAVKRRAELSIRWRDFFRVFGSVWVTLVCSVVSSESTLIESSFPVSRSSSASNYILFYPPSVLRLLAFLLLFWLGSATGHRSHTPTTTPFQYLQRLFVGFGQIAGSSLPVFSFDQASSHSSRVFCSDGSLIVALALPSACFSAV